MAIYAFISLITIKLITEYIDVYNREWLHEVLGHKILDEIYYDAFVP